VLDHPLLEATPAIHAANAAALLDRVYRTHAAPSSPALATARAGDDGIGMSLTVWPLAGEDSGRMAGLMVQLHAAPSNTLIPQGAVDSASELRLVNQRLLVAGVDAQQQADEIRHDLADLSGLLESLSDAVVIADASGRVVLINAAARAMIGMPEGSGSDASPRLDLVDRRRLDGTPLPVDESPVSRVLRGEQFSDVEYAIIRPDGMRLRLIANGSAIRDDQGQLSLAIVVCRDVSRLRELEQLKEEYVALISHDLRTPLTSILGLTQLLHRRLALAGGGDPEVLRQMESIEAQARRMQAMIADLLASSRMEAMATQLDKQPLDLAQVVADTAARIGSAGLGARLQIVPADQIGLVPADQRQIERVVSNLLTNALKYSREDAPIVIRVERSAGEVVVSVADEGEGIPAEKLPYIFDRFTRAVSGNQAAIEGVGLGLYIARLIVEAHGGRLWVESEVGKGSTFSFAVPGAVP
ncbi:MAG: sensor histidine kinase, partial [Dehalococcoidia bacterium]